MSSWLRRNAALAACAAAAAWASLVVGAPALAASEAAGRGGVAVAAAAYLAGSVVCHQQPGRSLHLWGAQLPVCARCTGLYLAGAAGAFIALLVGPPAYRGRPGHAWGWSWRTVLVLAALPMAASVGLEWVGAWAGSNLARAATGLPAGAAVGALLVESLSFRGKV